MFSQSARRPTNLLRLSLPAARELRIFSARISKTASWWFVSITVEMPDSAPMNAHPPVGIDAGLNRLMPVESSTARCGSSGLAPGSALRLSVAPEQLWAGREKKDAESK